MKLKYILITIMLALFASSVSACAGGASAASSWPGLMIDQDTAYLANGAHVYAINLSNGSLKWRFPNEPDNKISFFATPTLTDDGQLLVGGYNNVLYSLNPRNGEKKWDFAESKSRYIGSPLATEQGIFAPTAGETLYAIDLNGNKLGSFITEGPQWAQPVPGSQCDCIYLSSMDHYLYSINVKNNSLNWKTDDLGGSIVGKPAYSPDGVLYVGTFSSELIAIDARNGDILWRIPTTGWVWAGPELHGDHLYFGDLSGTFYALDISTHQISWQMQPDGPITETPLVTDDSVYFTTEMGTLYALDFKGNIRWSKTIEGSKLYTSPVSTGEMILVAPIGVDSLLIALDHEGNQIWAYTPQ